MIDDDYEKIKREIVFEKVAKGITCVPSATDIIVIVAVDQDDAHLATVVV